jgi:hypothetical protein
MSKFAVSLFIAATCTLGCRSVAPLEVKEAHSAPCSTAVPTTLMPPESAKIAPEVVLAKKGPAKAIEAEKEPPSISLKPREYVGTVASNCQKHSIWNSDRPFNETRTKVSKANYAEKTKAPTVESKPNPAITPEKDVVEKGISANQPGGTPIPRLPVDVWYAIGTIFGAVFTSILAPIAVEIIRGRIAIARHRPDSSRSI